MGAAAMMVNPPIQLEPGYFEFRVNWDAADLMQMTGAQLDRLHEAVGAFVVIAAEVGDGYDKAAMLKAAEEGPNLVPRRHAVMENVVVVGDTG
jgi:hypothetical protein